MERTEIFEAERLRLLRVAARVLDDRAEAEDVVQQAWLRLHRTGADIESLPACLAGWLATVTTRLCLDRLRARIPSPRAEIAVAETAPDPADEVALAESVGVALQVVLGSAHAPGTCRVRAARSYVDDDAPEPHPCGQMTVQGSETAESDSRSSSGEA